ncbi:MAG: adenine deaminase [Saprospirales bacterium]|nr:MAG: adenine deaminase [Saprospirales bacterium]
MDFLKVSANLIDIHKMETYPVEVEIRKGKIERIRKTERLCEKYILPGLVDAHVHIESSMLTPVEFSRLAVCNGTVCTVSDPHEIANVLGLEGVKYMINNGKLTPMKFHFGAPSCVPATPFESAGAVLGPEDVAQMLDWPEIAYLSEMMNFPGVLNEVPEVMKKLQIAKEKGVPIDGHAPQLRGDAMRKYVNSGISTDHECTTYEEALEKIKAGMKIAIREGSAAKNFEALIPLLDEYPDQIMFCTDDKHPDELILSHIDDHIRRALDSGSDRYNVFRAATLTPNQHYNLPTGLLREGDPADFILIDQPDNFKVLETWIDGVQVAARGKSNIPSVPFEVVNKFNCSAKKASDFRVEAKGSNINVIKAIDGSLVTDHFVAETHIDSGYAEPDLQNDLLLITVVNRYRDEPPAMAFINGFKLNKGAIASTVAHDSHNIVAVGTDRTLIAKAVNALIKNKGGVCATDGDQVEVLPLPIAGLLADAPGERVSARYKSIDSFVKDKLGSQLSAPFMTLSFMALLVIPTVKLSDKGLFDGTSFEFIPLFEDAD